MNDKHIAIIARCFCALIDAIGMHAEACNKGSRGFRLDMDLQQPAFRKLHRHHRIDADSISEELNGEN